MDLASSNGSKLDLDILGQLPSLHLYTQLSFIFASSGGRSNEEIIATLNKGLERLGKLSPWLTGEVIHEKSVPGNSGAFKIGKLGRQMQVVVKDHTNEPAHALSKFQQAGYPTTMLHEQWFASRTTFPDPASMDVPIFEVQVNFIAEGLIVTIVGHHQAMDMTGQEAIMRALSKVCRNELEEQELVLLNMPKKKFDMPQSSVEKQQDKSASDEVAENQAGKSSSIAVDSGVIEASIVQPQPKCSWVFFNFSASSLRDLKASAMASLTSGFVSTDDVLSALVWKSVIAARKSRLSPSTVSKFGRAVDIRRYVGLPKAYPGLMQSMAHHSRSVAQLTEESIGSISLELRKAVDPATTRLGDIAYVLQSEIVLQEDKSELGFVGNFNPSEGLLLSSWASVDGYSLDFGLGLGRPEMVRRPAFPSVESLAYFMPKTPQGDIALMICIRDDDMQRLRHDEEFSKYASFIG